MRKILYILCLVTLFSCEAEQESGVFFLSGYYNASSDSASVKVLYLDENAQVKTNFDRKVSLVGQNGEVNLQQINDTTFVSQEPLPQWNGKVTVRVSGDHSMHSTVEVPEPIEAVFQSAQEVLIQPDSPDQEVLALAWTDVSSQYSYLVQLENLAAAPESIPFDGGLFAKQFSGPIEENSITLVASDFEFYGPHRLTVYVITEEYKDIFFFQGRGLGFLAEEGPDNITGGKGFFTATRSVSFEFNVTQ